MQNLRMLQAFNNCLQHRLSVANGIFIIVAAPGSRNFIIQFPDPVDGAV